MSVRPVGHGGGHGEHVVVGEAKVKGEREAGPCPADGVVTSRESRQAAEGGLLGQRLRIMAAGPDALAGFDGIILGEVRFGILLLPKSRRRARLERWFDEGVQRLHCLPWEAETGLRWAELLAHLRASGRAMPIKDSLIAATALVHGLIIVTRNRSDFEKARVKIVDPFSA